MTALLPEARLSESRIGELDAFLLDLNRAAAGADPAESVRTIERVVDLLTGWPDLNELKHTSIPR